MTFERFLQPVRAAYGRALDYIMDSVYSNILNTDRREHEVFY